MLNEQSISERPLPGQRWASDSEPELGLGIVLKAEFGRVEVFFPAASEQRQYALKSAPLRRVRFSTGDRIKTHTGEELLVESIEEASGNLVYQTKARAIPEAELSDTISFSSPDERLLAGQVDEPAAFLLRAAAWEQRSRIRQAPARGFVGARIDLIPHQLYIAAEVASRAAPRVLLADEVGLGKTIEAGLILHRLHLTGRADRVLVLVPEPLIHQWFVELLRRFNLLFSIFDEERCASIERLDASVNPFLDSQLVIASTSFLGQQTARGAQAIEAGWDLLVVDEAHHLEWSEESASPEYTLVEALARKISSVLLLTATPQQLGPEGHFARLRLLDPDRHADYAKFLAETENYEQVAKTVEHLRANQPITENETAFFAKRSARIRKRCEELARGVEAAREPLIAALLDEFGTGRVMFRNTRTALSGFPERKVHLIPLELASGKDELTAKIHWLTAFLKSLRGQKVLLICRSKELAEQASERLQREIKLSCALFHEGLTLLQRDRQAAFFAEEDGAQILFCSEIGSEGRNFQFAHHLVLLDLPQNPELLEQRIGRLDRIGQTATIQIHVPFLRQTAEEVLARWFHEGLNAFEKNLHGAREIDTQLAEEVSEICARFDEKALRALIQRSAEMRDQVALKLARGHDRLLELTSCKPERAAPLIAQIQEADADPQFTELVLGLCDHFGVQVDELSARTYLLKPGHLLTDALSLPEEGISVTFDRKIALSREDLGFMTWDHPLVRSMLDLLLGAETGNAAFGVWTSRITEAMYLETRFAVECIAPAALHADRFLPTTILRVVVDHTPADRSDLEELAAAPLESGDIFRLLNRGGVKKKLLPAMLAKAQLLATEKMRALAEKAATEMKTEIGGAIDRLEVLRVVNSHVREDELAALRHQKKELAKVIGQTRLRIDALRLILRMPGAAEGAA